MSLLALISTVMAAQAFEISVPPVALHGIPFDVTVIGSGDTGGATPDLLLQSPGKTAPVILEDGTTSVSVTVTGPSQSISLVDGQGTVLAEAEVRALPGWFSVLPAIIAIAAALATRLAVPALFLGLWIGAALANGVQLSSLWTGLLDVVTVYVLGGLNDTGHLSVILFTLMIGGMVGIISKNGGTAGIVDRVVRFADSPRKGQATTGGLGLAIFFDDYANTMIVGTTMRPVTDRLRISREKLAYLVDATSAPVATLALVTTWIGFVVSVIAESLTQMPGFEGSAYGLFLSALQFSFYQILALVFVFIIAFSSRDFGPMLAAERRARHQGLVSREGARMGETPAEEIERAPKPDKPKRPVNALLPILVMVFGTLAGLYQTGAAEAGPGASLLDIIGEGDPFAAMIWASLIAVLTAAALSIGQRILTLQETMDAWFVGARSMLLTVIILSLAWALADLNGVLNTGPYLTSVLGDRVPPEVVPPLVFVVAAATAFATGSSWGVMGIVMPLAVPLIWAMLPDTGADAQTMRLVAATVAAVIGGAVWGDHCSPISDTTILSSIASGCDHIDHVRTQIPYALLVGVFAVAALFASARFGLPWWLVLGLATVGLLGWIYAVGRSVDSEAPES